MSDSASPKRPRGRPPRVPNEKGEPVNLYLSKEDVTFLQKLGRDQVASDGVRKLIKLARELIKDLS